jgi:hypothetical protein
VLIELSDDEAVAAAVMLPMVAADRLAPSASSHHDHREAQLIFARPINDHVHRTPRLGQWVLISGTWYQPLDRRLLGRAHLSRPALASTSRSSR